MRKPAGADRLSFIPPMVPRLFRNPPKGDEWIHEVKQDGYRTQIIKDGGGIRLFTKRGYDWTGVFAELAAEATAIGANNFILEGETIKINAAGLADFNALQKAIGTGRARDIYLVAFDLIYLNGEDLRDEPVERRRDILQGLIPAGNRIQFSEAMPGTGDAVLHLVDMAGVEGMVSKRIGSRYRSGPTIDWHKVKCFQTKTLEIIGVQRDPGQAVRVLMADNGRYVGAAIVNFKLDQRQKLWDQVQRLTGAPPPKELKKEKAEWLRPGLVGEVETLKGEEKLRHASLKRAWRR
ncbi:ATP-dependent DNA ligase [Mesorhizobium sp. CA4]|uniref:ATP-dependent DNA ligase n=1 Tax=Mesorhizobium sp. CA4 TaxID=588499 RepID=UPI001CD04F8E|nr:ATP-dependent DNA ligase [Mesorhizobium sp. CA4]MBZ9822367.1 ATP-dependent DNA ligase [Mesorhizobium sp. CA4]